MSDTQIIGLMGYARSGKDAVAETLVGQCGFTRIAFADKLREFLYALDPMIETDIYRYAMTRNAVDKIGWDALKEMSGNNKELSPRAMLQRAGIALRETFGNDILVDAALDALPPGGLYVAADVRFPNEVEAIRRRGGALWRVIRPGYGPVNGHISETAVDHVVADVTINNDSSLEALQYRTFMLAAEHLVTHRSALDCSDDLRSGEVDDGYQTLFAVQEAVHPEK